MDGRVEQIDDLEMRIMVLEQKNRELEESCRGLMKRNGELNIALMRKSTEASEAYGTLKKWRVELEILADEKGHNLCWVGIPRLLTATLGYTGKYPDPEGVTKEEFRHCCDIYTDDLFGKS